MKDEKTSISSILSPPGTSFQATSVGVNPGFLKIGRSRLKGGSGKIHTGAIPCDLQGYTRA